MISEKKYRNKNKEKTLLHVFIKQIINYDHCLICFISSHPYNFIVYLIYIIHLPIRTL